MVLAPPRALGLPGLERVLGNVASVQDLDHRNPQAVWWIGYKGSEAEGLGSFCYALQAELGAGSVQELPTAYWLEQHGGFFAHLKMVTFGSGLVLAEIHDQEHRLVFYQGDIIECRGVRDGKADAGPPHRLRSLFSNMFSLKLSPASLEDGGYTSCCTTQGERQLSFGAGMPVELALSYALKSTVPPGGAETVPSLSSLELAARHTLPGFGLEFHASGPLNPAHPAYTARLVSGDVSFHFDGEGSLAAVKCGEAEADRSNWGRIYDMLFGRGEALPAINVAATMAHVLEPFSGKPLDVAAYGGRILSGRSQVLLDLFLACR